jgi:hypothetical protein
MSMITYGLRRKELGGGKTGNWKLETRIQRGREGRRESSSQNQGGKVEGCAPIQSRVAL